jgi:hypothetical protein
MSIEFLIYLIGIVDLFRIILITGFGVATVVCFVEYVLSYTEPNFNIPPSIKKMLVLSTIALFFTTFIPNSKTITAIATVHYDKEFITNDNNELVKLRKLLNLKLDEYLKEEPK